LKSGDSILIDSGCEYKMISADVTRCFPVDGRFPPRTREIYSLVLEANRQAIQQCVVGSNIQKVHETAVEVLCRGLIDLKILSGDLEENIRANTYKKFFMHRTSHWLGMDIHDVGRYDKDGVPTPFEEGMVLTVEPGLYFNPAYSETTTPYDGIGIRIEDDVLITAAGPEVLTAAIPKEIDAVETA